MEEEVEEEVVKEEEVAEKVVKEEEAAEEGEEEEDVVEEKEEGGEKGEGEEIEVVGKELLKLLRKFVLKNQIELWFFLVIGSLEMEGLITLLIEFKIFKIFKII